MTMDCDLVSTMEARHPGESKNSTKEGLETIDHILIAKGSENNIAPCGQLPFNLGFHTDHRTMFVDIAAGKMLSLQMLEPKDRSGR